MCSWRLREQVIATATHSCNALASGGGIPPLSWSSYQEDSECECEWQAPLVTPHPYMGTQTLGPGRLMHHPLLWRFPHIPITVGSESSGSFWMVPSRNCPLSIKRRRIVAWFVEDKTPTWTHQERPSQPKWSGTQYYIIKGHLRRIKVRRKDFWTWDTNVF